MSGGSPWCSAQQRRHDRPSGHRVRRNREVEAQEQTSGALKLWRFCRRALKQRDDKPCFILLAPQMGENIGAAARVMANFGLT